MNGSIDYFTKNINRKLVLLAGYCLRIEDKEIQRKAGEAIAEIQDMDLPEIVSLVKGEKNGQSRQAK